MILKKDILITIPKFFTLFAIIILFSTVTILEFQNIDSTKSKGNLLPKVGSASSPVCGDRLCSELSHQDPMIEKEPKACTLEYTPVCGTDGKTYGNMCMLNSAEVSLTHTGKCNTAQQGVFPSTIIYTKQSPEIDPQKGYFVAEIADGLYWLIDGGYQMMFLTTGQGVIVVDAPEQMEGKILQAISEVTNEPVTHVIYSHIHKDHIGAAHIYPDNAVYITHSDTARHLAMKNDPDRPVPTESFDDTLTLSVGDQVLVLSYEGAFHSKGDIIILAPKQKVAMVVDLFHPDAGPFLGFGITTDMNAHLAIHDILLEEYDFDVLVPAHEQILALKDHLKTNKQFALNVMANVIKAQQIVDYMDFAQQYGSQGRYAVYANYFDAVAQTCAELTLEVWQDKLKELEPFMKDHCRVMSFYVSID